MRLVYEKYYVLPFLYLLYYLLYPVLEHAPEYRACDDGIHLKIHYLLAPEPLGHLIRLEFYLPGQPFDHGRLPDARLAYYHHGITPLHVAEYLHDPLYLTVAAYYRGKLVITREFIQVYGKVLQVRRQFVFFLQLLFHLFLAPYLERDAAHHEIRIKPETAEDFCRKAVVLLKDGDEKVGGVKLFPAPPLRLFPGEPEDVAGGRRDFQPQAYVLAGDIKVLVQEVKDMVYIEVKVFHDLPEEVLFDLCEGEEQVFDAEVVVLTGLALLDGGLKDLSRRGREFFPYIFQFSHDNLLTVLQRHTRHCGNFGWA